MRFLLLCLVVVCGCDGSLRSSGTVIDAKTRKPVEGAEIWYADRVLNTELAAYLDGKAPNPGHAKATTGADGTFAVTERLAGPGGHEVWLVVRKPGYAELRRQIWKGTGLRKSDPTPLQIELVPEAAPPTPTPTPTTPPSPSP